MKILKLNRWYHTNKGDMKIVKSTPKLIDTQNLRSHRFSVMTKSGVIVFDDSYLYNVMDYMTTTRQARSFTLVERWTHLSKFVTQLFRHSKSINNYKIKR